MEKCKKFRPSAGAPSSVYAAVPGGCGECAYFSSKNCGCHFDATASAEGLGNFF